MEIPCCLNEIILINLPFRSNSILRGGYLVRSEHADRFHSVKDIVLKRSRIVVCGSPSGSLSDKCSKIRVSQAVPSHV